MSSQIRISVILFILMAFGSCHPDQKVERKQTENPERAGSSIPLNDEKRILMDSSCRQAICPKMEFRVPQANDNFREVNEAIYREAVHAWGLPFHKPEEFASAVFTTLREEAREDSEELEEGTNPISSLPWQYFTRVIPVFNRYGLLSLKISLQKELEGRILFEDEQYSTLEIPNGTVLKLEDLFTPGSLEQISAIAEDQYHIQSGVLLTPDYEACAIRFDKCQFELPGHFYLSEKDLILAYMLAELGPESLGTPIIRIPYPRLLPFIEKQGPLGWVPAKYPVKKRRIIP